ncbi:hypothetical protein L486_07128 [Kwoniella mangroviensis CBS 10435]|uniref:Rad51-like C-terminal domain-containing protein n=1 Tax=Kwoniella mangroviensis CBS 10435 TaxID=1331196 RepID=A0A1B9IJJ5_9TREE|nr:uncharacterized protein I203_07623 [Kwoniella mangroviensis CBS 8507]OCF55643.1 hypothetical protein L486_07128 [Kwoniella mangroviensis CBS 10435]OCF63199.1 hypothetical protein I203_07623 [Kwoniella mangroviensis CBS 8507]
MLLKRLADTLPAELASLIPELDSAGIKTTESLIFSSPSTIFSLVPILSNIQLEYLISTCVRLTGPDCISGDAYEEVEGSWQRFGIDSLDELLKGWDGVGVIELAGPRKVGKSLLALHASLRILASDPEAICTWIDTEGSFSPERAKMILEEWHIDEPNSVLERMVVINAFKLEDMFETISQLKNSIDDPDARETRILVVDTIFTHFKDLLSATSAQGHADLITLMEEIAEITYSRGMVSFIINSTASSFPTNPQSSFNKMDIKPALGASFTFTTDMTLLIQETGRVFGLIDAEEKERIRSKPGLRGLVEVIRSRMSGTGAWTVFETDGIRMFDVTPPHEVDERTTRISEGLPTGPYRPKIGSLAQTLIP